MFSPPSGNGAVWQRSYPNNVSKRQLLDPYQRYATPSPRAALGSTLPRGHVNIMFEPPRIEKRAPPPSRRHNTLSFKPGTVYRYTNGVHFDDTT